MTVRTYKRVTSHFSNELHISCCMRYMRIIPLPKIYLTGRPWPHKITKKNWPALDRKMSALAQSSFPCPCGHTINFEKSEVLCTKKCERPHLKNPLHLCPQNVCTGQSPRLRMSWTAHYELRASPWQYLLEN